MRRFNMVPPALPAIDNLKVTAGISSNLISWSSYVNQVAVYGSTTNNRANATLLGTSSTTFFSHSLAGVATWYYWVRGIDNKGREVGLWTPLSTTAGIQATAKTIQEVELANSAVTAAKLAVAAISPVDGKLVQDAVDAVNIKMGAVTAAKTNLAAIDSTTGSLKARSVTATHIAAGTITANEISSSYVYAGELSANKITSGTMSANYIYGGTINGNYVNVTNLNASNINAGTMSADRINGGTIGANVIYGGTISADKISAGTLKGLSIAIFGTTYNALRVTAGSDQVEYATLVGWNISAGALESPGTPAVTGVGIHDVGIKGVGYTGSSTSHGVRGVCGSTSGLIGSSVGYDFYADGINTGNYGPFTGAHDCLTVLEELAIPGDIMVDKECAIRNGLSNTLFIVTQSTHSKQKNVIGVYIHSSGLLEQQYTPAAINNNNIIVNEEGDEVLEVGAVYQSLKFTHNLGIINALGEGQVNVCGENGDIQQGDYITTSSIPGKGMKQDDDLVHNYTVAKARESVTFSSPTEVKMIACIYVCG